MSHTLVSRDGKWYWRNWLGLTMSPSFNTKIEAEEWKERMG